MEERPGIANCTRCGKLGVGEELKDWDFIEVTDRLDLCPTCGPEFFTMWEELRSHCKDHHQK